MNLDIPAHDEARDVVVTLPLTDMSDDGRNADIHITAGGIEKHFVINGNTNGLALNLTPLLVENVPGNVTTITVDLISDPSNNPSSFLAAGLVVADAQCETPEVEGECETIGYDGAGTRHFWFASEFGQDFTSDNDGLKFTQYADGTATLAGEIYRISNSNHRFDVFMSFHKKADYDTFVANGNEAKLCNASQSEAEEWMFYEVDNSRPNIATGLNSLAGEYLYLRNMDDTNYGLQIGTNRANCKNDEYGMSIWFSYSGTSSGHGDINAALECENLTPCENFSVSLGEDADLCAGPVTLTAEVNTDAPCCPANVSSQYLIGNSTPGCLENYGGTTGPGVFYRKANGASSFTSWSGGSDLYLTNYNNGTGTITGSIHHGGETAQVDIDLVGLGNNNDWWNCSETYSNAAQFGYDDFSGTITLNGTTYTINDRSTYDFGVGTFNLEAGNPLGMAAWSGGTWGEVSEIFGQLSEVDCAGGGLTYAWSNGASTPSITASTPGSYTVTVTDCHGCEATDTVSINPCDDCEVDCPSDISVECDSNLDPSSTGYPTLTCESGGDCVRA
ncbi:MAG: hypothetical protein ACPGWM_07925, partial [Flavobacteriales bacterium]